MKIEYGEIMSIIENERDAELECAKRSEWIMKKTLNPIRKIRSYISKKMFMNHVVGIELVICQLKKFKEES